MPRLLRSQAGLQRGRKPMPTEVPSLRPSASRPPSAAAATQGSGGSTVVVLRGEPYCRHNSFCSNFSQGQKKTFFTRASPPTSCLYLGTGAGNSGPPSHLCLPIYAILGAMLRAAPRTPRAQRGPQRNTRPDPARQKSTHPIWQGGVHVGRRDVLLLRALGTRTWPRGILSFERLYCRGSAPR